MNAPSYKYQFENQISVQSLRTLSYSFRDLLSSKKMLQITLIQSVGWIAATFVLQGTSIFSEQLPGNFFLNVGIMGIVASLASLSVIILNDYFSRQKFQGFTFFLTGLCCVLCSIFQAIIPEQTILIITLGILAKFSAQSKILIQNQI